MSTYLTFSRSHPLTSALKRFQARFQHLPLQIIYDANYLLLGPTPGDPMPTNAKTKLHHVLEHLYTTASTNRLGSASAQLSGGLVIMLRARPGAVTLTLAREDTFPADLEWQTVLKHLPPAIQANAQSTAYNHTTLGIMHALTATFPTQLRLI